MQRRSNIKFKNIGLVGSSGLLCLLAVALLAPLVPPTAYADDSEAVATADDPQYETSTVEIAFSKNGEALSDKTLTATAVTPIDGKGVKSSVSVDTTITVTNSKKYDVYINGSSQYLKQNGTSDEYKLSPMGGEYTYNNIPSNTWGYTWGNKGSVNLEAATYHDVPEGRTRFDGNNNPTDGSDTKDYTIGFAANFGTDMPSGKYSNTVTLSVISNPTAITTFDVETLQELTVAKCQQVTTPINVNKVLTTQLRDERDDKMYWVSKMPDGNCWMVQNLDLDIPSGTISASASGQNKKIYDGSQMSTSWTPTAATTTNVSQTSSIATDSRSWDQGLYVFVNPKETTACAGSSSGNQGLSYSDCASKFQNVSSGWTASTDPDFASKESYKGTDNSTDCTKTKGYALNQKASEKCKIYDAHYLVGNWYQWTAATAGAGTDLSSQSGTDVSDVTQSICPTNWRLPASGGADTNKPLNQIYSFGKLLKSYGWNGDTSTAGSMSVDILTSAPLFFVRSGAAYSDDGDGYISASGNSGSYWSSTAWTRTDTAYRLYFDADTTVLPSGILGRRHGLSVRCLVPAATS